MIYTISIITLINKETNIQSDFSFPPFDYGRMEDGELLKLIIYNLQVSTFLFEHKRQKCLAKTVIGFLWFGYIFLQYFHAKRDSWNLRIFKKG